MKRIFLVGSALGSVYFAKSWKFCKELWLSDNVEFNANKLNLCHPQYNDLTAANQGQVSLFNRIIYRHLPLIVHCDDVAMQESKVVAQSKIEISNQLNNEGSSPEKKRVGFKVSIDINFLLE